MKSIVVGASAGLGRALAEVLARRGHDLVLVASDSRDLSPLASDLAIRFGIEVFPCAARLGTDTQRVSEFVLAAHTDFDNLFLIAGQSSLADAGSVPDELCSSLAAANFNGPIELLNALLPAIRQQEANLVVAGTVASIRARKRNSIYASAKAGLEFYAEALRHSLADTSATVCCYRLGYLATSMTFGQRLPFPALQPAAAAESIIGHLGRRTGIRYLPGWWGLIALVMKLIPWPVFKRLNI